MAEIPETQAEEAWRKKVDAMSEPERKAYYNEISRRQEEELVVLERRRGNLAWRIAREFDVWVTTKSGEIWLVDMLGLGVPIKDKFDMWFPRTRQLNNRRYIHISESDLGWSIKCIKTPKKIITSRVKRGSNEEREHNLWQ